MGFALMVTVDQLVVIAARFPGLRVPGTTNALRGTTIDQDAVRVGNNVSLISWAAINRV